MTVKYIPPLYLHAYHHNKHWLTATKFTNTAFTTCSHSAHLNVAQNYTPCKKINQNKPLASHTANLDFNVKLTLYVVHARPEISEIRRVAGLSIACFFIAF